MKNCTAQAGNFRTALSAWANLPDTTDDQLDYIWLTDKAITLAQNSQGWEQLDSSAYSTLLSIAVKNSFSGFMAAGVADFLGLRSFVWPSPDTDTGQQGARPGNFAGNQSNVNYESNQKPATLLLAGVSIYPNPTNGLLTVDVPECVRFSMANLQGQQVAVYELQAGRNQIKLPASIAPGVYIGKLTLANGRQTLVKIVYQP